MSTPAPPLALPGTFVTFHHQTIDPETGEVLDTTFPALLVRNVDNPNPPAPDMTNWAHLVAFGDDGIIDTPYSFVSDPPRNGSYTALNAAPPVPNVEPVHEVPPSE
jgi:hypothetical protein